MQHECHMPGTIIERNKVVAQDQTAFDTIGHNYHILIIRNLMEAILISFAALIVIAADQMNVPVHLVCVVRDRCAVPVGEIAQHIDVILLPDLAVPSADDLHVHFLCRFPGPFIKPDAVGMPQVQVTYKICLHFLSLLS